MNAADSLSSGRLSARKIHPGQNRDDLVATKLEMLRRLEKKQAVMGKLTGPEAVLQNAFLGARLGKNPEGHFTVKTLMSNVRPLRRRLERENPPGPNQVLNLRQCLPGAASLAREIERRGLDPVVARISPPFLRRLFRQTAISAATWNLKIAEGHAMFPGPVVKR
jgi:hypothetical protein